MAPILPVPSLCRPALLLPSMKQTCIRPLLPSSALFFPFFILFFLVSSEFGSRFAASPTWQTDSRPLLSPFASFVLDQAQAPLKKALAGGKGGNGLPLYSVLAKSFPHLSACSSTSFSAAFWATGLEEMCMVPPISLSGNPLRASKAFVSCSMLCSARRTAYLQALVFMNRLHLQIFTGG